MRIQQLVRAVITSAAFLGAFLMLQGAVAMSQGLAKDLGPQPLADALEIFAANTGLQIVYLSKVASGLQTQGAKAGLSAEETLRELLRETGLSFEFLNDRTIAVVDPNDFSAKDHRGAMTSSSVLRLSAEGALGGVKGTAGDEGKKGFWSRILLAQNDPTSQSTDSAGQQEGLSESSERPRSEILEGVTVTARKREERLIDVPISIGVVTAGDIDRRGLVNSGDYLRGMPGANQVEGSPGQTIVIRGIEANTTFQGFRGGETTGTYFGETPTVAAAGLLASNVDIKLVDIDRVEVLRGPQGTAFGSASMGGTVRVIPAAPKLDRFDGKVAAGYSVTARYGGDKYKGEAVLNVPLLQDLLAIRAVAYNHYDSGFYRNRAGSDPAFRAAVVDRYSVGAFAIDADEVGGYEVTGGRIAALLQPSSSLSFTLSYLTQDNQTDGVPVSTSGSYDQAVLRVAPQHVRRGETLGVSDQYIDVANATMQYDLGWSDLVATYSHVKGGTIYERSYTAIGINWPVSQNLDTPHEGDVGEVRLTTKLAGAWNLLAGLYGEESKDSYLANTIWFGDPALNTPARAALGDLISIRDLKQTAAFGEVYWDLTPRWTLTGGARAFRYERDSFDAARLDYSAPTPPTIRSVDDSDTTYRANVSYKPYADALFYAGFSQGFRVGGSQGGLPSSCDADGDGIIDGSNVSLESTRKIDSDNVDSYEIGGKFAAMNSRFLVNAAIYRMDWSGIPVSQLVRTATVPGCPLFGFSVNAGTARSDGLEFQANWEVTPSLRVDFGGSYVDSKLTDDVPTQGFRAGNRMPGTPKLNGNLGLQYEFPVLGYRGSVRTDAIYVGSLYGDLLNSPVTKTNSYVKVDVGARLLVRNASFDFFVRNLTNEDAFTFRGAYNFHTSPSFGYQLRPRTVGIQVGYSF